jgi:Domain of Unknown Function with PDB structure (DUF3857)
MLQILWCALRFSLLFVLCAVASLSSQAQDTKKNGSGAQAAYSSEAYVIEEDSESVSYETDGTGTREATTKVLVQSGAGVQQFGLLTFPYQKSNETAEIDYVRVRKPDGSIVPTPPDNVQDMPAKITQEAPFYSDLREKQVPVKGLSVGDVVEYQCHWRETKPMVPGQFRLFCNCRMKQSC